MHHGRRMQKYFTISVDSSRPIPYLDVRVLAGIFYVTMIIHNKRRKTNGFLAETCGETDGIIARYRL